MLSKKFRFDPLLCAGGNQWFRSCGTARFTDLQPPVYTACKLGIQQTPVLDKKRPKTALRMEQKMLDGLELPEIEEIIDQALHRESQGLPLSLVEELVLEIHRDGLLPVSEDGNGSGNYN